MGIVTGNTSHDVPGPWIKNPLTNWVSKLALGFVTPVANLVTITLQHRQVVGTMNFMAI